MRDVSFRFNIRMTRLTKSRQRNDVQRHPMTVMKRTESIEGRLSTAQPIIGYNYENVSNRTIAGERLNVREH